jgi:hypothetical protein
LGIFVVVSNPASGIVVLSVYMIRLFKIGRKVTAISYKIDHFRYDLHRSYSLRLQVHSLVGNGEIHQNAVPGKRNFTS